MKCKVVALKKYTGIETTVISPIPYVPSFLVQKSKKWAEYHGVGKQDVIEGIEIYYPRYIRFPGAWFRVFEGLSMFLGMLPLLLKFHSKRGFDLVLGGNLNDDGFVSLLTGRMFGIKATSYAIGSDVNTYPYDSRGMMILTKFLLRKLDLVICVGKGLKKNVEETLGKYKSLSHNYLGVSLENFLYSPKKNNRKLQGIFVGEVAESKGVFDLVKAITYLDSNRAFCVSIIGGGIDQNISTLKSLMGSDERVKFLGRVPHSEVAKLFNESDFFIFPTYTEGCSCALTEAAASGLPIITTDIIQNLDFKGENSIIFEKGNVEGLKKALVHFLDLNSEQRENMARAARKLAEENFEEKKAAVQFSEILESILARGP